MRLRRKVEELENRITELALSDFAQHLEMLKIMRGHGKHLKELVDGNDNLNDNLDEQFDEMDCRMGYLQEQINEILVAKAKKKTNKGA